MEVSSSPQPTSPLISIIIPTLNNGNGLNLSIQSVIDQSYKNIEIIIIDGGSDDGTVGIIKQYESQLKFWSSEKDKGIYDAMNKGISQCTGEWLLFLGGDDRLYDKNVLEKVFFEHNSTFHLIYGDVEYENQKMHKGSFGRLLYLWNTVHHQGAFYNRRCFEDYRFNENFKILGDYELNLLLYKKHVPAKKVNFVISLCGMKGISKKVWSGLYREELTIKKSILEWYAMPVLFVWIWMKYFYKSIK